MLRLFLLAKRRHRTPNPRCASDELAKCTGWSTDGLFKSANAYGSRRPLPHFSVTVRSRTSIDFGTWGRVARRRRASCQPTQTGPAGARRPPLTLLDDRRVPCQGHPAGKSDAQCLQKMTLRASAFPSAAGSRRTPNPNSRRRPLAMPTSRFS
jgi:hypothetical protein